MLPDPDGDATQAHVVPVGNRSVKEGSGISIERLGKAKKTKLVFRAYATREMNWKQQESREGCGDERLEANDRCVPVPSSNRTEVVVSVVNVY